MINAAFLLALGLMALQPDADSADRYVPATGWEDDEWASRFYERRYGNQLRAMGERPLATAADLEGFRHRFRLLVLPNDHPAFAYRVDVKADGSTLMRWARLDGAGGYAPGNVATQGSRPLRPRELRRLTAALEEAALGSRPRKIRDDGLVQNADGTTSLVICLHATHYVFEQLDEEGRRFVSRRSCDLEPPLHRLARVLYRLRPLGRRQ